MSDGNDGTGMLIDLAKLRLRFDDDDELLEEIFQVFIDEAPGRRTGIAAALEAGDMPWLTALAHALKGVAGTLFAEPLRQAAYDLEKAARAGDVKRAAGLAQEVWNRLEGTVAVIRQEV